MPRPALRQGDLVRRAPSSASAHPNTSPTVPPPPPPPHIIQKLSQVITTQGVLHKDLHSSKNPSWLNLHSDATDKSFQRSFPSHQVCFHDLPSLVGPWFSRFEAIRSSTSGGRSWWPATGGDRVLFAPGRRNPCFTGQNLLLYFIPFLTGFF